MSSQKSIFPRSELPFPNSHGQNYHCQNCRFQIPMVRIIIVKIAVARIAMFRIIVVKIAVARIGDDFFVCSFSSLFLDHHPFHQFFWFFNCELKACLLLHLR
jgi:hypothetical protein